MARIEKRDRLNRSFRVCRQIGTQARKVEDSLNVSHQKPSLADGVHVTVTGCDNEALLQAADRLFKQTEGTVAGSQIT